MHASVFKDDILSDQVAIISGGGSGIGLEIAKDLGRHGCKVCIMGRRVNVLEGACAEMKAIGIRCMYTQGDVRSIQDCENCVSLTVARFGPLRLLVNCAAGNFLALAEDLSSNAFRSVLEIDTLGTFNMCKAALPALQSAPHSHACVINISATMQLGAAWFQSHAAAAKSAIDSLTRSLALEWGAFGVRVVGVAPGPISDTTGMARLAPEEDQLDISIIPLGRFG